MKIIWYNKYEIQESTWEWKEFLCFLIIEINIMKLATLSINLWIQASSIKILEIDFIELEKSIVKFVWKHKRPLIAQITLSRVRQLIA